MYVIRREMEKKSCTVENFCCIFCCKRNGFKTLLAKPCQALWVSASCVCKQLSYVQCYRNLAVTSQKDVLSWPNTILETHSC